MNVQINKTGGKMKTDIEKARRLLDVLEMKAPRARVDNLIRLLCVKELSKHEKIVV